MERMRKTAPIETVGCTIDAGQEAKTETLIHADKGKGANRKAKPSAFAALPGLPLAGPEPLKNFGVDKTSLETGGGKMRILLLLVAVAPAFIVHGQVNRSWEVLMESLKPDKRVVVTKMTSGNVEGKLLSITADSITVQWRGQPTVVQRPDVFRVRIADTRMRHTLIGMAIGAGVGVVWGANLGDRRRGLSVVVLGGLGTGFGAAAGGVLPIGPPLYQVEKPVRKAPPPARPD